MEEIPNLWPAELIVGNITAPNQIMKRQAEYFNMTVPALRAEVYPRKGTNKWLVYDFFIYAPSVQNYSFNLFSIEHDINIYPVEITFNSNDNKNPPFKAKSEKEFIDFLKHIFNHDSTKHIISSLIAMGGDMRVL